MKKWGLTVAMLATMALGVEILSFSAFSLFKENFTFFEFEDYLLSDEAIRYVNQGFDPVLGWDTHYETPFGERPRPKSRGSAAVATFGDSYTFCTDVEDGETWQEVLGDHLGRDVYNFGTGGYGTDQALLKFREKYPQVKTPVVVMGLVAENINRIVNVYRPFYSIKTGQRVTKPRFRLRGETLELISNPVSNESDLELLKAPSFIEAIGRNDYWYNRNEYPVFLFPYSRILFNRWMWAELAYNRLGYAVDDLNPRPWENLWEDPEATQLMFAIFDSFVREATDAGGIPVILMIPKINELTERIEKGRVAEGHAKFSEFCRSRSYDCLNPIDGFVGHVEAGNAIHGLYRGHTTPAGNRIIAERLYTFLREVAGEITDL